MGIALNMMVYNEAPFLPVVLEQLRDMTDYFVIMDNGSWDGSRDIIQSIATDDDVIIWARQDDPINYAKQRNGMLQHVSYGDWVLKWDADELPSDLLRERFKETLVDFNTQNGWRIPIYHLMTERECLPLEYPYYHLRLFRRFRQTKWVGDVHEQIEGIPGEIGTMHVTTGMCVIHFSYFCHKRLERKAEHYAKVPNSGFSNPKVLTDRLSMKGLPLPEKITYTASEKWLREIKESL